MGFSCLERVLKLMQRGWNAWVGRARCGLVLKVNIELFCYFNA